jgi:urease accessory protein
MNYLLWQLADSAFPSGAFAHSGGLEASLHHGHLDRPGALAAFARQSLAQTGRGALPIMRAVHQDPVTLAELDALSDAFLSGAVANRASRAQGRAFLTSVARSFRHIPIDALESAVKRRQIAGHFAPIFGATSRLLGVPQIDAERLFLFLALRGIGAAAVRLGLIGAYEAQELQHELAPEIDAVLEECAALSAADVTQTTPLIELVQSTHDRLYSRLFQS